MSSRKLPYFINRHQPAQSVVDPGWALGMHYTQNNFYGRSVPPQSQKWGAPELARAEKWGFPELILDTMELTLLNKGGAGGGSLELDIVKKCSCVARVDGHLAGRGRR